MEFGLPSPLCMLELHPANREKEKSDMVRQRDEEEDLHERAVWQTASDKWK